jgi:DNA-binding NtrC family response regulator
MRRLLLVENDRTDCGRLVRVLTGLGYGLDVTFHADDARMLNERNDYSWSVIANPVNGEDGVALFNQLRRRQNRIRGLLVTDETDSEVCTAARTAGLDIASRPIDVNVLVPWLSKADPRTGSPLKKEPTPVEPMPIDESTIGALSEEMIRGTLPDSELIRIIRGVDYPFAGKGRLESFDRDTLVRVVLLIKRWCLSRR